MDYTLKQPLINCDWLQLHIDTRTMRRTVSGYDIIQQPIRTKTFATVLKVSRDGRDICTIACDPHSPKLPAGCGTLKLENYILYTTGRLSILSQIIQDLNINALGITRIDIAGDCQTIADREPEELIKQILNGEVIKVGHAKQSIIGVDQVTAYGRRHWEYLRYGGRSSRVSAYLYNKSKELRDESDKPYIRALWAANGFAKKKRDTWRLEFSIKGRDIQHINEETGEVLEQDWHRLLTTDAMATLYTALCRHYFSLAKNDHTRRTRCSPLPLWREKGDCNILLKYLDATKHNNRSDKIFLRKLITLPQELQDPDIIRDAADLAIRYAQIKDLTQWMQAEQLKPKYSNLLSL